MSDGPILQTLAPVTHDLGGFKVHRTLPHKQRTTVGPFTFFDQMGPASLDPGNGVDVRPHPHINLATVTYLFAGAIDHRDSLGTVMNSSPRISSQRAWTGPIFVKNRCPPMSNRNPLYCAVREMPPTMSSPSRTVTE